MVAISQIIRREANNPKSIHVDFSIYPFPNFCKRNPPVYNRLVVTVRGNMEGFAVRTRGVYVLVALAVLAVLPYLPALTLPFIADDYFQIALARLYGPSSGWPTMAADALYRCRATSLVMTYWTERFFGLNPIAYNWSSLILHILNTWLVFALGAWRRIGWRISAVAAAFFAVYEGHQEAVIWYSALPELLVFLFSLAAVLLWILHLQVGQGLRYYAASLACFMLALGSKESAVAVVGLLLVTVLVERANWKRRLLEIVPYAAVSLVYAYLIFTAPPDYLHLHDGTFSPRAHFWVTLFNSTGRLFWIWGFLGLAAVAIWRNGSAGPRVVCGDLRSFLTIAMGWILITFLPYSFLTYMPRVPSRHTYFASVGLSLIVAAGFLAVRERFRARWIPAALAAVIVLHNCGYLWTRKQTQYLERAAPTEQLIKFARQTNGPVYVHCFAYSPTIAEVAVEVGAGKPHGTVHFVPDPKAVDAPVFCMGHSPK